MKYNKESNLSNRTTKNETFLEKENVSEIIMDASNEVAAITDTRSNEDFFCGNTEVDKLQKAVYSKSIEAVESLARIEAEAKKNGIQLNTKSAGIENAKSKIKELQTFSFNVGFAGEQSCGKSTIINSLIGYPLMPTCKTATTATVVRMAYSKHYSVTVFDDDTNLPIFEYNCEMPNNEPARSRFIEDFNILKKYCVDANRILLLENPQYYTDQDYFNKHITPSDLEMIPSDPKIVMFLFLVLFSVYVGQDDAKPTEEKANLMKERQNIIGRFGIKSNVVNFSVMVKGDFELLKSGMMITDLPGLGSMAEGDVVNGHSVKSHDDITKEAIASTDAMVFAITPFIHTIGFEAVKELMSTARVKESTRQNDFIIPLVNYSDKIKGDVDRETTYNRFIDGLTKVGANKDFDSIFGYSAIFGEYRFDDISFERTLFFRENQANFNSVKEALLLSMPEEQAKASAMASIKNQLEKKFATSGIVELENFFKTDYVDKGKISKSEEIIAQIENAFKALEVETRKQLENIKNSIEYEGALNEEIIEKFQKALIDPIAKKIEQENKNAKRLSKELSEKAEKQFEEVQQKYADSFNDALVNYKTELNSICTEFNQQIFSYKAKITPEGSHNWETYVKLEKQIEKFPFSVVKINKKFAKIIDDISATLERRYDDALNELGSLESGIHKSLDDFLKSSKVDLSADVYLAVEQTTKSFESYVSDLLKMLSNTVNDHKGTEHAIKDNIYSRIVELNDYTVSQHQAMIIGRVAEVKTTGFFFSDREYLNVEKLQTFINGLNVTNEEAKGLKDNVEAEITAHIRNHFADWIQKSTVVIQSMFTDLHTKVNNDVKDLKKVIASSGTEKAEKQDYLNHLNAEVRALETDYNNSLQADKKIIAEYK